MSGKQAANELFVWVIQDPSGRHGILTQHTALGAMPIMSSHRAVAERWRDAARDMAKAIGCPIELRHFANFEVIDTVMP